MYFLVIASLVLAASASAAPDHPPPPPSYHVAKPVYPPPPPPSYHVPKPTYHPKIPSYHEPKYEETKKPYSYAYGVQDEYAGTHFDAAEDSDGHVVTGHYSVLLPDGRKQLVKYTADHYAGYIADVSYEAPKYKPAPYKPVHKPAPYQPTPVYKPVHEPVYPPKPVYKPEPVYHPIPKPYHG